MSSHSDEDETRIKYSSNRAERIYYKAALVELDMEIAGAHKHMHPALQAKREKLAAKLLELEITQKVARRLGVSDG